VFDIDYADGISRPDTNLAIYYSPTGQPAAARLVLFGQASNIAEDQSGYLATLSENVFEAGSSGTGDPFIGPVALPEGTYYIGVTNGSQVPSVLNDTLNVRREPVNSVRRLVEERFYLPGDNAVLTSADAPVFGNFIDTGALPAGWSLDTVLPPRTMAAGQRPRVVAAFALTRRLAVLRIPNSLLPRVRSAWKVIPMPTCPRCISPT
jgi:hypothetical protein